MKTVFRNVTKWPLYLLCFASAATGAYFLVDALGGNGAWAVAALVLGCLIFAIAWYLYFRRHLEEEVLSLGLQANESLEFKLENLALPFTILTNSGDIIWTNEAFRQMLARFGDEQSHKAKKINEIFPDIPAERGIHTEVPEYVSLGTEVYRVFLSRVGRKLSMSALMLMDETEHLETARELRDQTNVAGLLYIDNYDEVMKSTETEHQGFLAAIIEQKIQKYFQTYGGIVFATQKDHFFVSVNAKGLRAMKEDRFSLLEDIKTVKAGNETPVTVSMAFCTDGESYEDNRDQAQKAMDLALGRGGDQAVVRTAEGVEYFGGKSIGGGSKTRVKARVKAQALRELMAGFDQIFIMGHPNGDNDSFGACVAVYRAAASLEKEAHIIVNSLTDSAEVYRKRFEESDSYPSDMIVQSRQALASVRDNAMVVVVDTNRASLTECPEILEKVRTAVVFDHHRQMAEAIQATLSYVEPYASSACELVTEMLQYFGEGVKPRPLEAEAIYTGIVVDTNNFTDRTGVRTFDAAAYLKRSGADLTRVKKALRENVSDYRARAEAARNAELFQDVFAFAVCPAEGVSNPQVLGAQTANELMGIAGVKASFVFTPGSGFVYVSARSIDEVNVQLIMERIGGGGHLNAAGAQLKMTPEEAVRTVKETITAMQAEGAL